MSTNVLELGSPPRRRSRNNKRKLIPLAEVTSLADWIIEEDVCEKFRCDISTLRRRRAESKLASTKDDLAGHVWYLVRDLVAMLESNYGKTH
jgi:hypothetical protein